MFESPISPVRLLCCVGREEECVLSSSITGLFDRLDEGQKWSFEAKISRETHVFWPPSSI